MSAKDDNLSLIHIPGVFFVELDESEETPVVRRLVFMPHGSNAGYFGPSAEYSSRSSFIHTMEPLDLEDSEGPFWRAMQKALGPQDYFPVTEDHDEDAVTGTVIPIVWEE